ncbi:MAG: wax ester/triacylglycerol synthase family O-acyltransferase [Actinomycetota bacterium]
MPPSSRQLESSESRLLAVETPTALGHTSSLAILDAAAADHPIDGRLLTAEVEARLDELPVLRQCLMDVPLGLDRPWWRDDPGFDLNYHLRYIAVPDPDDASSLAQLVARIHDRPLDRRRPLWELYLISGLSGGRVALLSKVHLAALGSAQGNEIAAGLIGSSPELRGDPDEDSGWRPGPGPTTVQLVCSGWRNAMLDPFRVAQAIPSRLTNVPGLRALVNPALALLNQRTERSIVLPDEETITPRTSFNHRVGAHRRWAKVSLDFERIAAVRRSASVSTVDVLAALCAGALRWWLLEHDELPRESLKALVPLSVTDPDAIDGIAGAVIHLQTHRRKPDERLAAIHADIGAVVERHGGLPAAEIQGIGGGTPILGMIASRLLERSPLADRLLPPFNTVITSVPGPKQQQYALGAPVAEVYPVLGVVDGIGLHFGAMSVGDRLCLSLVADRDLVPDLDALAARLPEELTILERTVAAAAEDATA